jgi:hypothetical protein
MLPLSPGSLQVLLFLGYTYSHLTSRLLGLRGQTVVHLGLVAVAALALPMISSETWKPSDGTELALHNRGLLGVTVGLPDFLLSSTGPLRQAWFVRARFTAWRRRPANAIGSTTRRRATDSCF